MQRASVLLKIKPYRTLTHRAIRRLLTGLTLMLLITGCTSEAASKNGFDLSNARVPIDSIQAGGPPRDGIPPINEPVFAPAQTIEFLEADDRVLGVVLNGQAKAYPIPILNWHEIINDAIGGTSIAVTYCPLCGSGMVFNRQLDQQVLQFGTSGLLYNSNLLMYDQASESLWSQALAQAIAGPRAGERLSFVPARHMYWAEWRKRYPQSRVLTTKTGYARDYHRSPYGDYRARRHIPFPVGQWKRRYHPKTWVMGLALDDQYKAYPYPELAQSETPFTDQVGDQTFQIHYDPKGAGTATVTDIHGQPQPALYTYWFAWAAFYPDAPVYTAE